MSTEELKDMKEALIALLNSVQLAQSRGSYTMPESYEIFPYVKKLASLVKKFEDDSNERKTE